MLEWQMKLRKVKSTKIKDANIVLQWERDDIFKQLTVKKKNEKELYDTVYLTEEKADTKNKWMDVTNCGHRLRFSFVWGILLCCVVLENVLRQVS